MRKKKQLYGYFKQQTSEILHQKTWTWLQKGNHKKVNLIAQDNAIRINCVKAKIDKTQ